MGLIILYISSVRIFSSVPALFWSFQFSLLLENFRQQRCISHAYNLVCGNILHSS
ncbi:unnamed protein product [Brugia timori]|uniref:Uncharacterized protein n=1 Tax=Brugia timori TaxID=42155 RepID=A0A0R3QCW3_9BILA|nr:unnamed protein product [Brugia timori]